MSGLEFDALGLVAVAGTGLLAVTGWITDRATRSKTISSAVPVVTMVVLVWAFAARHDSATPLAVAALALTAAEVIVGVATRCGWRPLVVVGIGGIAAATAGVLDGDAAAGLAVAGLGIVVLVAIATRRVGVVALPGLFVIAAHHLGAVEVTAGDVDRVGLGVALVGALAAGVVLRSGARRRNATRRLDRRGGLDPLWNGAPLGLASFAVAVVVLAQDAADLRAAGLLVAGGAVLATASRHPIALIALVPGAAAAVEALAGTDRIVHAVAGASVLAVVVATSFGSSRIDTVRVHHWPAALALVFAVVPLWGWSGADVAVGYNPAVAAAIATAGAVGTVAYVRVRRGPAASSAAATYR